ncbi:MAG: aldehyde dehydrogenase (NADP(+)) [Fimbriimonas sp.]
MIRSLIGFQVSATPGREWQVASCTDGSLGPVVVSADLSDLESAVALAEQAFPIFAELDLADRARFLRAIADEIEADQEAILASAQRETALPLARFQGELARTCFQLRCNAEWSESGDWLDIRKDPALPDRKPAPKPELRSAMLPLGPVVVFGAANFPLAYSTAGNDTASALATGCPVIVKSHPAHPETSWRVGLAIVRAAQSTDMPEGVFSLLFDDGLEVGQGLVVHPAISAIGFTGSRAGGNAILKAAQARPTPIPVYAEMSSVNPTFVLNGARGGHSENFAKDLVASVTLGVGQFCTNPGIVILVGDDPSDFLSDFSEKLSAVAKTTMLTDGIAAAYERGLANLAALGAKPLFEATPGGPAAFVIDHAAFLAEPEFQQEVFGPSTLFVTCPGLAEAVEIARKMEGQLTAGIHGGEHELAAAHPLFAELARIAGRVMVNQFPTGVEVSNAVVHGGPHPSTSDGRTTSVGHRALHRWTRPVCYQNVPEFLLPKVLR